MLILLIAPMIRPVDRPRYLLVRLDDVDPLHEGIFRTLPKSHQVTDAKPMEEEMVNERTVEKEEADAEAEVDDPVVKKEFKKEGKKGKKGAYRWIPAGPVSTYGVDLGDAHQQNIDYIDYY